MNFSLSDVLLVLFLHDLEKPWRLVKLNGGTRVLRLGLEHKFARKEFREKKLREYGITFTEAQQNAFTYIEGECADYQSNQRVMNELASFCHRVDAWSACERYDYPKDNFVDEWLGASKIRTM